MSEMVRLHKSFKEIWECVNESYVHPVKDQITVMKKTNTYMPTLLMKLLQSQCVVHSNENSSLHEKKVHERNPSYKIKESLDQMNSKLTAAEGEVISGIRLMNDENFYVSINGMTSGKNWIVIYLLQLQTIVSFNENNSLHKEKLYERNPSFKIY